jgi:hypothetical protein
VQAAPGCVAAPRSASCSAQEAGAGSWPGADRQPGRQGSTGTQRARGSRCRRRRAGALPGGTHCAACAVASAACAWRYTCLARAQAAAGGDCGSALLSC